jgi:tRNA 2-thiouridine synthesizing protein A
MSEPVSEPGAVQELDCRGMSCPRPIIELAKAFDAVARGGMIGLIADDPAARVDVQAWCRMRGQEYAGSRTAPDGVPVYLVRRLR